MFYICSINLKQLEIMKTTFKIFGLKEERIIRESFLTSTGIENETELVVTRHHQMDFDNEFDAMDFIAFIAKNECNFEHGFEIVKTFRNN